MAQESVLRIIIDSRNAERNAHALANELESIEKKGDFATKSMDSLSVATRQLAGYMAGVVTVGAAISKMDAYTGMQNRLKLVTESQEQLNLAMSDTFTIAQKSYQSWDSVIQVYQRFSDNAKTLNIDMAKTAELTETVSKAVAISGASTQAAEGALTQFGQALASGVLRGEELNSILEQTPALAKAIAQGMGITIGQLRSVAAEGKITGEVLVDALTKSKKSVDELFAKTDVTIGQSLQLLSNEVTKFTGEAGKASGVATTLASSIQILANNLDAIAGIAVVGGVALLTKTIAAQTVAIHGSITAVVARRAADTTALQSQVQLAAVEVQRTRQVTALAAQEIHLARQELNSATTRQARAAATMRLTQAEIAHSIALKESAAAVTTQTTVENALNASRSRSAMLLGLVGGPIGALTIGVAALTAGYMYLKSRTAEANAKLEEQAAVAKKAKDELLALKGLEKDNAVNDMAAAFERQNAALSESSSKINMQLNAIEQLYKGNKEVVQVVQDARNGTISMTEAVQRFNELRISKEVYESIKANTVEFEKNAKEATNTKSKLNLFGIEVELSGRKAQTAAVGVDENSRSLSKNKTAAEEATEAQKKFKASLFDREFEARLTKGLLAKGYTPEQVANMVQTANWAQKNNVKLTNELYQAGLQVLSIEEQNKKVIESKNAAEKKVTQEKEKQLKLGQRLIGISGNSGIGTGAHLDVRYGGSRDGQKVSKEHLARLEAGGKSLSNYRVSSDYGNRKAPAKGASSFHKGIDFAMPVGTPITTKVAVKDIKTAYDSKGGGYYSTVTFEDGVVLKLLHQSPSMMGKVKGGASDGTLKSNQDIENQAEQQANTQLQLQMAVATERKRIETQLQEDIKEINKAGFSPEETKRLTAEYQARADNDIAIAEYALKTKLDDYESFRKTESQLLEDSFNERKFYASRDLELTKDQRDKAVALLDEQLKQEQALLMLARETRLFQYREALMTEAEAVRERYRIEMLELSKIVDIEERRIAMQAKTTAFIRGSLAPVGTPLVESDKGKSNTQLLQEETGRELLAMQNRYRAAQVAAKDNADELLRIERDYLAAKEQLHAEHDVKLVDARQADFENQLQVYSQIAGLTAQTFDQMTSMLRDSVGESNALYKTMFLAGKAASIAQAIVNTEEGATKALAQGGAYGSILAGVVRATGYASVGLIAAQTIAGFANGGYTGHGGKYEPAGVVHKGEGVLTQEEVKALGGPQGFEDLRKSIRRGYSAGGLVADTHRVGMGAVNAINSGGGNTSSSGGDVNITVNVTDSGVTTQSNQSDQKQLGQMIGNAVRAVIRQEQRQGGLLSK